MEKTTVIEYSNLPDDLRYERTPSGELKYDAGSIAIHVMDVDFLERVYHEKLPFNKAFKAIPYVNEQGEIVKPEAPNAYKFEMFVFDAFSKTQKTVTMTTDRKKDFAPVKNKDGNDSPATARAMLSDYYKTWLKKAGVDVSPDAVVEISPLYAIDAQELKQKIIRTFYSSWV
jgi:UDP-N-acetylglucosamine/UDP-N-acetylgalactosamine diphosphorylase